MSDGISGFGTTLSGSSIGAVGQITGIDIPGMSVTDIDVSTMVSTNAWKEFIAGMKDAGEISLELLYESGNHNTLQGALGAAVEVWTITLPDGSTFACSGYIREASIAVPMDDKISQSVTIKLSGEPTFTAA